MKITKINTSLLQFNMKSLTKALVCGTMMLGMLSCEDDFKARAGK
ncbi:hypothetical protein [Chryseobacterium indoltheticum]